MSSGLIVGLELLLVLGGVIGLAVWDLSKMRREMPRRPSEESSEPPR